MSCSLTPRNPAPRVESTTSVPAEVRRLLEADPGPDAGEAWSAFLAAYSGLLLRAASIHATDYDAVLDRYAYMLDELRRDDCRRLRRFVADGRCGFSGWLTVVARRLCLDHHRSRYGRPRDTTGRHAARRQLADLRSAVDDLEMVADPEARRIEDALDDQSRRDLLERAVSLLSPADQTLLHLRFEQDLTAREIARLVGLPSQFHVYRRLRSVCASLRAGFVMTV